MKNSHDLCGALLAAAIAALGTAPVQADPAGDAATAIRQAEAARQQAAAVGGEWSNTATLIQDAQAAVQAGDYARARDLAHQAREQGRLGYQQALQQRHADFPAYLR
jgi:hypothetical protein